MYGLYKLKNNNSDINELILIEEISKEKFDNIGSDLCHISGWITDSERLTALNVHYKNIINIVNGYDEHCGYEKITILNSEISAYLSAFKKFLDNWETDIKHKYGKHSQELNTFKGELSYQYDNNDEYKLMYELRNYDQHCGNILDSVECKLIKVDETKKTVICAYIHRDKIISNFDFKQATKDYLLNHNEKIDFISILQTFHKCITQAFNSIIKINITNDFLKSCNNILENTKNENYLYIMSIPDGGNKVQSNMMCINRRSIIDFIKSDINSRFPEVILVCNEKDVISNCIVVTISNNITNFIGKHYIKINGQTYLRFSGHTNFNENRYFGIFVNTKNIDDKTAELLDEYDRFLNIIGESHGLKL